MNRMKGCQMVRIKKMTIWEGLRIPEVQLILLNLLGTNSSQNQSRNNCAFPELSSPEKHPQSSPSHL
jgi:hypothetical protein